MGKKYAEPPVVEALCEFYFVGSEWDSTVPGVFYDRIRNNFPEKSQLKQVNVQLQFSPDGAKTQLMDDGQRGRFQTTDKSKMVQIAKDLLVVNHLKPYPKNFKDWQPLVMDMLDLYREFAKPKDLARIGVRYINRIEVDGDKVAMETYFRMFPQVPADLAAYHGPFLMRLEVPTPKPGHQLILSFTSAPAAGPGKQAFLLDLYDIFPVTGKDTFQKVAEFLADAQANVEHAFESAITDEARKLFKEIKS